MILSCRKETYSVPITSACLIHSTGQFRNGDTITVSSPVFSSFNYKSGAINTSEQFEVPLRLYGDTIVLTNGMKGTLHCNDSDIFNLYVEI